MNALTILMLIAMLGTAAVLIVGMVGFWLGGDFNRRHGNRLMQWRVGLQFVAVILVGLVLMSAH